MKGALLTKVILLQSQLTTNSFLFMLRARRVILIHYVSFLLLLKTNYPEKHDNSKERTPNTNNFI